MSGATGLAIKTRAVRALVLCALPGPQLGCSFWEEVLPLFQLEWSLGGMSGLLWERAVDAERGPVTQAIKWGVDWL